VASDEEWTRFLQALEWAPEPRLATVLGRRAHEAELNARIAEWTRQRERENVVARLREHGLRAAPVNSMADLFADPQLRHRQTWRPVDHPVLGRVHVAAPPYRLSRTPAHIERPAPCLGQDTQAVLTEVLGLPPDEIDRLQAEGVLE
jgi:crotonobetainyl-CoA:carnitine CoA-transferase CaiB-like acyl-CoA transferase